MRIRRDIGYLLWVLRRLYALEPLTPDDHALAVAEAVDPGDDDRVASRAAVGDVGALSRDVDAVVAGAGVYRVLSPAADDHVVPGVAVQVVVPVPAAELVVAGASH